MRRFCHLSPTIAFAIGPSDAQQAAAAAAAGKKRSKLEELMHRDLEAKKRRLDGGAANGAAAIAAAAAAGGGPEPASSSGRGRVDHWLAEGLVVKVMSKALKEHGYYKQKVRPARLACGGRCGLGYIRRCLGGLAGRARCDCV
jgi:hypothetical protein